MSRANHAFGIEDFLEKFFFRSRIVLHIPHSSFRIPFSDGYAVNEAALFKEQLLLTDLFTDDLFNHPDTIRVIAGFSRIFCDVERFPDDAMEIMSKTGMGMLYEKRDNGRPLRKVTPAIRERIITDFYNPHHQKLEDAVENQLKLYGKALILDCHSFPDTPLRRDLNQQPGRPDFNIGTDPFHTPQSIVDAAAGFFKQHGFTVGINWPYEGTIVPLKFYRKDKRVVSIMLEVNRKLYQADGRPVKHDRYDETRGLISRFLDILSTTQGTF